MKNNVATAGKNRIKGIIYIMALLLMSGACIATDHVVISEVLYDPLDTESGGEAVELYNPTAQAIDISGYVIKTESSATDATIPADTVLAANSFYLLADSGWSTAKDDPNWAEADHEEAITMSNTDAGVALLDAGGVVVDAVGWGSSAEISTGLFEGTPAAMVAAGNSLKRSDITADNEDNSIDFAESVPDLKNTQSAGGGTPVVTQTNSSTAINLNVSISNNAPSVESITILQDGDVSSEGTQIMPEPESTRTVPISAEVTDIDGIGNLVVTAIVLGPGGEKTVELGSTTNTSTTSATYNGTIEMQFYDTPGEYTVTVLAEDGSANATAESVFEYMSMTAISVDATGLQFQNPTLGGTSTLLGDFALSTLDTPTLRNTGNTNLDVGLYGTDLVSGANGIGVDNIKYSFDNDFSSPLSGTLSTTLATAATGLSAGPDSVISLGFQLYIPTTTQNGDYTGDVTVVAISG